MPDEIKPVAKTMARTCGEPEDQWPAHISQAEGFLRKVEAAERRMIPVIGFVSDEEFHKFEPDGGPS